MSVVLGHIARALGKYDRLVDTLGTLKTKLAMASARTSRTLLVGARPRGGLVL